MDRSTAAVARERGGERATRSPFETRALGRALGAAAEPGMVLALIGPLGAGKTQLAKGVAEGLGVTGVVNSPTFILMNEHVGRLRLFHVDAYRLTDAEAAAEALAAGLLDERQGSGVTVIEWADRLRDVLPDDRLEVEIELDGTGGDAFGAASERRTLRWSARGPLHEPLASVLEAS